ncbi:antibiotic biosynthesis monooxygenase, partial [Cereibacter changlensis]
AFETVWKSRDSQLPQVPGFVSFHLMRGPSKEDHTLYASHTLWASRGRPRSGAAGSGPAAGSTCDQESIRRSCAL